MSIQNYQGIYIFYLSVYNPGYQFFFTFKMLTSNFFIRLQYWLAINIQDILNFLPQFSFMSIVYIGLSSSFLFVFIG